MTEMKVLKHTFYLYKGGVRGVPETEKPQEISVKTVRNLTKTEKLQKSGRNVRNQNILGELKNRTKNRLDPQNRKPLTSPSINFHAY